MKILALHFENAHYTAIYQDVPGEIMYAIYRAGKYLCLIEMDEDGSWKSLEKVSNALVIELGQQIDKFIG